MRRGAKGPYTRRTATRDARVEVLRTGARARPLFGGDAETPYTLRTAKRDTRVEVLRTSACAQRARSLPSLRPFKRGSEYFGSGRDKDSIRKTWCKKETPLKNVLQVGILIIYIMGLKLVVGVG